MKILIIDNRPVFRTGIRYILKKQFGQPEFRETEAPEAFDDAHPDYLPDLVILGLSYDFREHDPLMIKYVRKNYPEAGLIVLYKSWNIDSVRHSFEAGVDGYLFENTGSDEWLKCVQNVMRGKKYAPSDVLEDILTQYVRKDTDTLPKNMRLSGRQLEIARLLNQNMTVSGIAESLGRKVSSISTVKARLFKKLNISSLVELKEALEVYQNGQAPSSEKDEHIPGDPHG